MMETMLRTFETKKEDVGKRLDIFLLGKFPDYSRSHIKNLIEHNLVKIDQKLITKAGFLLKNAQKIENIGNFSVVKDVNKPRVWMTPNYAEAKIDKLDIKGILYADTSLVVLKEELNLDKEKYTLQ